MNPFLLLSAPPSLLYSLHGLLLLSCLPHLQAQGTLERDEFLMNPYGLLYNEVTASSLVRVNSDGDIVDPGSTQLGVNRAGLELHSAIYRCSARRDVKCVLHLHTVAGAAVSGCIIIIDTILDNSKRFCDATFPLRYLQ